MNRTLFVKMAGAAWIVALGMSAMGCAVGIDDGVEPTPAPPEQVEPPQQALNGELRTPQTQLITALETNVNVEHVAAHQVPRIPMPIPQPE